MILDTHKTLTLKEDYKWEYIKIKNLCSSVDTTKRVKAMHHYTVHNCFVLFVTYCMIYFTHLHTHKDYKLERVTYRYLEG